MRCAEEKLRSQEERRARCPEEAYERKSAERLEKAKRRCDRIRQIIGAFDPANLNSQSESSSNVHATTSAVPSEPASDIDPALAVLNPTAETIRLLSNAIAGCLQPCNLINKILSDIIGMVPQPPGESNAPSAAPTSCGTQATGEASTQSPGHAFTFNDQQQQTEFMKQNSATNTSDLNTPVTGHPSNQEIEALFKEAAKELEKMNEIVNNSKTMESSSGGSIGSSMSAITQVERFMQNMTDSTFSNATLVNAESSMQSSDNVDCKEQSPGVENDFKIVTPNKSMRSRESSIEVHDVNSMMSDDSRDWTMLDAAANDDEEEAAQATASSPLIVRSAQAEQVIWKSPVVVPTEDPESLKTVVSETPSTPVNNISAGSFNEDVRASIQQSIENAAKMNAFVKNSVAMAQESLKTVHQPPSQAQMLEMFQQMERNHMNAPIPTVPVNSQQQTSTPSVSVAPMPKALSGQPQYATVSPQIPPAPITRTIPIRVESVAPMTPVTGQANAAAKAPQTPLVPTPVTRNIPVRVESATAPPSTLPPILRTLSASTQANLMAQANRVESQVNATTQANLIAQANRVSTGAKPKVPQVGPAVIVYDPNPKINAAVHQMMTMGFSNEGQ